MDKRPEKMTEQDKLLELQLKMSPKTRVLDIITIILLMLIIYGFSAATFITPDKDFSEQENRYLQKIPELSLKSLISGKFTSQISDYFSDQFPIRDTFVGIKSISEIAQLKMENNSVVLCKNGYIVKRTDYPNLDIADKNIEAITKFSSVLKELNVPYTVAIAGRSIDALQRYLPPFFPTFHTDVLWNHIGNKLNSDNYIQYVNLLNPLKAIVDSTSDEQIYYRTDHHWTTKGAYYGYCEIMKSFGMDPQPLSSFTIETASDQFYGTTWSSAGMKWIKPDSIQFFRYDGDNDLTTEIVDTGVTFDGFYDYSFLQKKDKYSSFISGNNSRVNIFRKDGVEREKLLLIKDSFAHSMAPFLAYHFDLVIIDLRYYKMSVKDLIVDESIDRVLIMNNASSFIDSNVFGILNLGLK